MRDRLEHLGNQAVLAAAVGLLWGIVQGSFAQGAGAFGIVLALLVIFTW